MANLLDHPPLPTEPRNAGTEVSRAEVPEKSGASLGWGRLAAQIAQWTTRGFLCAVIVVASVGFGRQVLRWWYDAPPEHGEAALVPDPLAGLGEEERLHRFRFGNAPWELRRQVILGDAGKAWERLKVECTQATLHCQTRGPQPGPQERQLLASLKDRSPVSEGPGWAVYGFHDAFPLVVGIKEKPTSTNPSSGDKTSPNRIGKEGIPLPMCPSAQDILPTCEGDRIPQKNALGEKAPLLLSPTKPLEVAPESRSVVSWGLAVPSGEKRWTLYIWVAVSGAVGGDSGTQGIPLPPEGKLFYSLCVPQGGGVILFQGPPRPETWKSFYETYFRTHGGRQVAPWQQDGVRWKGRFLWQEASEKGGPQGGRSLEKVVEIYLGPGTDGSWTGLIWIWAEGVSAPNASTIPCPRGDGPLIAGDPRRTQKASETSVGLEESGFKESHSLGRNRKFSEEA